LNAALHDIFDGINKRILLKNKNLACDLARQQYRLIPEKIGQPIFCMRPSPTAFIEKPAHMNRQACPLTEFTRAAGICTCSTDAINNSSKYCSQKLTDVIKEC
jgi:hypothetical protein